MTSIYTVYDHFRISFLWFNLTLAISMKSLSPNIVILSQASAQNFGGTRSTLWQHKAPKMWHHLLRDLLATWWEMNCLKWFSFRVSILYTYTAGHLLYERSTRKKRCSWNVHSGNSRVSLSDLVVQSRIGDRSICCLWGIPALKRSELKFETIHNFFFPISSSFTGIRPAAWP